MRDVARPAVNSLSLREIKSNNQNKIITMLDSAIAPGENCHGSLSKQKGNPETDSNGKDLFILDL
jgi:hypothetical protein